MHNNCQFGNCMIAILSPSGGGKDTVILQMEQSGLFECCQRVTTRSPRPNHAAEDHKRYHFVTEEEFDNDLDRGLILLPNVYAGYRYGVPLQSIQNVLSHDKIPILKGVIDNIPTFRQRLPDLFPNFTLRVVYIFPDSNQSWLHRIEKRGKDGNVDERIKESVREMEQARKSLETKDGVVDIGITNGHYQSTEVVVRTILDSLCLGCPTAT